MPPKARATTGGRGTVLLPVAPGLYQGPESATAHIVATGVTHVVSVGCRTPPAAVAACEDTLRVGLPDDDVDTAVAKFRQALPGVVDFIDRVRGRGKAVLVHCKAGISRSAAFVVGYLMLRGANAYGVPGTLSPDAALAHLRRATGRARVQPNAGFMLALVEDAAPPAEPGHERATTGTSGVDDGASPLHQQ